MENKNLIPPSVFCPKCAKEVGLTEIRDPLEKEKLIGAEYSQGARGVCSCGVYLVLLTKSLPAEPTFTILFNIYKERR